MTEYTMALVDDAGKIIAERAISVAGERQAVEANGRQIGFELALHAIHDAALNGHIERKSVSATVEGAESSSVAASL